MSKPVNASILLRGGGELWIYIVDIQLCDAGAGKNMRDREPANANCVDIKDPLVLVNGAEEKVVAKTRFEDGPFRDVSP